MRQLGDLEEFNLEELTGDPAFAGVKVYIEHVGPGLARQWTFAFRKIQETELPILVELRRATTKEESPELWPAVPGAIITARGMELADEFSVTMGEACISRVEGWPSLEGEEDKKELTKELKRLGVLWVLMNPMREVQGLTPEQFPAAKDHGDIRF